MIPIPEDTQAYYKAEPEQLEIRIQISREVLENYLRDHEMMHLAKPVFVEWERLWVLAKSYWQFPDQDDMKKLVDKHYAAAKE